MAYPLCKLVEYDCEGSKPRKKNRIKRRATGHIACRAKRQPPDKSSGIGRVLQHGTKDHWLFCVLPGPFLLWAALRCPESSDASAYRSRKLSDAEHIEQIEKRFFWPYLLVTL